MSAEPNADIEPPRSGPDATRRPLSRILTEIAEDPARARVSIRDLIDAMGDRAFGALLLVFALPNAIPAPPGTSGVLGVPLVILTAQLMLRQRPWLPDWILRRSMTRADFAGLVGRMLPWLAKAEKLLRPRLLPLTRPAAEHAIGALGLVLAIVLLLPIPLGNMLPAIAICIFALGILERDGVWIIAGAVTGAAALALVAGVLIALVKAVAFILSRVFAG
jgi:hypothetical protein